MAARRWWIGAVAVSMCLGALDAGTAGATPRHALTKHQVQRIVSMTGYHGLRSHHFTIASSFRAGRANTVVVQLDGAELGEKLGELRKQLGLAAALAAGRPTFTTRLRLGSGTTRRITFHVAPANVLTPHQSYARYVIFTRPGQRLSALTRPERVPDIQALTVIDAANRLNVTLLQDRARHARWGPGVPAGRLFATVESLNTTSYVFLTPKTLEQLARQHVSSNRIISLGREIWSNSYGFAIVAAQKDTSYRAYRHQAAHLRFNIYRPNDLHYLTVSKSQYLRFSRA